MQKQHFSIMINAPKEKVWDTMLQDATYRQWTEAFHKGSYYQGDWNEGSKIRFLGPEADGKLSGMISRIKTNRPYEFISIEHLGIIENGVEDTTSEKIKSWAGAHENYTFTETNGTTTVTIDTDTDDEYIEMFQQMWPKALQKLKALAEK